MPEGNTLGQFSAVFFQWKEYSFNGKAKWTMSIYWKDKNAPYFR